MCRAVLPKLLLSEQDYNRCLVYDSYDSSKQLKAIGCREPYMKITKAEFVTSISGNSKALNQNIPQIVIMGRSNVGKSSLINSLTNQKKLAKTSQQPGQTRLINAFLLNDQFYLIDLPGYGYAKASNKEKGTWEHLMNSFFEDSENSVLFVHLVDIRHKPSELDIDMAAWISQSQIPRITVATKADKLSKSQCLRSITEICKTLEIAPSEVVSYSIQNNQGKAELLRVIDNALKQ